MKKITRAKLALKQETIKLWKPTELAQQVVGGVTSPCNHPTSTVLHTGDC